jgi:hypothetical protein
MDGVFIKKDAVSKKTIHIYMYLTWHDLTDTGIFCVIRSVVMEGDLGEELEVYFAFSFVKSEVQVAM